MKFVLAQPALFVDALALMVVGMFVVFVALLLLMVAIHLLTKANPSLDPDQDVNYSPVPVAHKPLAKAALVDSDNESAITPELVAVLTAAATAALGQPVRVTRVERYLRTNGHSWKQQERHDLSQAYRPRRP